MRARTARALLVGLVAVAGLGCESLLVTEPPTPPALVERALESVTFGAPRTTDGYVDLSAYLPFGHDSLESNERVRIQLSTSTGDAEELSVGPGVCRSGSARSICREYVVMLSNPSQFASVANAVNPLGARMNRIGSETSEFAVVYVFADAESFVRQQIAVLAGIESIERNHLVSIGYPEPAWPPMLHAAIKVNAGSAREAGDGVLTVQVGDVITLTYPGVGGAPKTITRTVIE